jgi:hypothetical protein
MIRMGISGLNVLLGEKIQKSGIGRFIHSYCMMLKQKFYIKEVNVMLCWSEHCPRLKSMYKCSVYSPSGMLFRHARGYCPITNVGPNVIKGEKNLPKKRAGQQKSRKK